VPGARYNTAFRHVALENLFSSHGTESFQLTRLLLRRLCGEKEAWQRSLELGSESQTNTGVFEFLTSHSRIVSSVPLVTNFELSRYILTCDMAVPGWWACGISTLGLEVMRKSYAMIVPSRQPATICSPF
jgi:hypothetical protein